MIQTILQYDFIATHKNIDAAIQVNCVKVPINQKAPHVGFIANLQRESRFSQTYIFFNQKSFSSQTRPFICIIIERDTTAPEIGDGS